MDLPNSLFSFHLYWPNTGEIMEKRNITDSYFYFVYLIIFGRKGYCLYYIRNLTSTPQMVRIINIEARGHILAFTCMYALICRVTNESKVVGGKTNEKKKKNCSVIKYLYIPDLGMIYGSISSSVWC